MKMPAVNKLTPIKIKSISAPGRYGDGRGLYLQVSKWQTKAWLFRFTRHGKAREMGLGPVSLQRNDGGVSLAEAREEAHRCCQLLRQGIDPIEHRNAARAAARLDPAKDMTFKQCAEAYISAHKAGWRNPKHADQWTSTLMRHAYAVIGDLPVAAVDTALVTKILEPIWQAKPETAGRVRGRIEAVLDWASARGYRSGENPARWRGHLDKLLPNRRKLRKVSHHAAMPYADLPAFMATLRSQDSISARALEFTILTAARTGEAIGATWEEIDLEAKTWTVPGTRTKSGREHRVPLNKQILHILKTTPRELGNAHLFIGARKGRALSNMAMLELLRGMDGRGLTVHGFRSSFRDWAAEQTNFPREVAEAALAHVLRDSTEAAYRRSDLFERRRKLMDAWATYCSSQVTNGNIVPIRVNA
jgi:integrase